MLTMWIRTNSNPRGREVDDCVVRALAEATGRSWRAVYLALAVSGCEGGNMPDANIVESESLTHVSYNIKTGNAERIRRAMSETGKSGGAIIDELIERYLG